MTPEQHEALCNHLMDEMSSPGDCDHTLRRTKEFLAGADIPGAISWLRERGGYCDCEVLLNTMPMDEAPNDQISGGAQMNDKTHGGGPSAASDG